MVLNGLVSENDLKGNKKFAWFDNEYNQYRVDTAFTKQLLPFKNDVKVLIIAGSWCSDTQRELPRFFKIANAIGLPSNQIETIMVNENKVSNVINISILQVTNIPAFIIYKDGKEQGRIIEAPIKSIEEDLLHIITKL